MNLLGFIIRLDSDVIRWGPMGIVNLVGELKIDSGIVLLGFEQDQDGSLPIAGRSKLVNFLINFLDVLIKFFDLDFVFAQFGTDFHVLLFMIIEELVQAIFGRIVEF